ncbi:MAG: PIN domain-containing protein [Xanthomonadales bacterium]|nr:PIN domain-containing protein [Xanthomonadales bacterium]
MAAEYLLDSNIIIAALNSSSRPLLNRLAGMVPQRLHLSSIVLAELLTGVAKSGPGAAARHATLNELVGGLTLAPFDNRSAEVYARVRAKMELKGQVIGPLDLLIAAQALSSGLVLVTDNLREFRRVPDLVCENWLR